MTLLIHAHIFLILGFSSKSKLLHHVIGTLNRAQQSQGTIPLPGQGCEEEEEEGGKEEEVEEREKVARRREEILSSFS